MAIQLLELHSARLYQLNEQGKNPFLRQTKHFEETSELAEAVICQHAPEKILGEAVDGLLMLLSIAADYLTFEEFQTNLEQMVESKLWKHWDQWQPLVDQVHALELPMSCLKYISYLQYITTAVQRVEGVASSTYKGSSDSSLIIDGIITAIDALGQVIALIEQPEGLLQSIYNEKMDKWERVSK